MLKKDVILVQNVDKEDIAGTMNYGASDHIFQVWKCASDVKDSSAVIETAS